MIQAKLYGRKTQTRRIIKTPNGAYGFYVVKDRQGNIVDILAHDEHERTERKDGSERRIRCPYGQPGDILWARESWRKSLAPDGETTAYYFKANDSTLGAKWKPSIHMPKLAARIWDLVINVRVQRLKDISKDDAISEGICSITKDGGRTWKYGIPDSDGLPGNDDVGWAWDRWDTDPREAYFKLWADINGQDSVDNNDYVFAYTTETISIIGRPKDL